MKRYLPEGIDTLHCSSVPLICMRRYERIFSLHERVVFINREVRYG